MTTVKLATQMAICSPPGPHKTIGPAPYSLAPKQVHSKNAHDEDEYEKKHEEGEHAVQRLGHDAQLLAHLGQGPESAEHTQQAKAPQRRKTRRHRYCVQCANDNDQTVKGIKRVDEIQHRPESGELNHQLQCKKRGEQRQADAVERRDGQRLSLVLDSQRDGVKKYDTENEALKTWRSS